MKECKRVRRGCTKENENEMKKSTGNQKRKKRITRPQSKGGGGMTRPSLFSLSLSLFFFKNRLLLLKGGRASVG